MKYWWVSQNKTYKHEIGRGYMWSPKVQKNGKANKYYLNMTKVSAGDWVLAFYQSKIQSIGVVQTPAVSSKKPIEFGTSGNDWSDAGWLVPVTWSSLPQPMSPKEHIETLKPFLPKKYAPIRADGTGNQAYLFPIDKALVDTILRITGANEEEIRGLLSVGFEVAPILEELGDRIEQQIQDDINNTETEKEALIKARRGQGKFKSNLMQIERMCRLTGVSDERFLIASHIKAWSQCDTNGERLDGYNGFLFSPNADKLFDRGFISFEDNGDLLVSSRIDNELLSQLGIVNVFNVGIFSGKQKGYLAFHRQNIFKT